MRATTPIGLDTNVLLRWLVDETVWPTDAPEQLVLAARTLSRPDATFFVNAIVLAELTWVLARPLNQRKPVLAIVIDRLLKASNIVVDQREAAMAALRNWRDGTGEFSDHFIGEINRINGCATTLTFDRAASRSAALTHLTGKP